MEIGTEQVFIVNNLSEHNQHATPLQRAFAMPVAAMEPEDTQQTTVLCQLPQNDMHPPSRTNMCRLCATITELVVPIFEGEGLQNSLADKIHQHLPIQVSPDDILPIVMCFQCTSTLLAWHELVVCSMQADSAMRERFKLSFSTTQEPQQQTNIEASDTQSKDIESQVVSKIVTNVLKEYFKLLNIGEDGSQAELACQSCDARRSRTTAEFVQHIVSEHGGEVATEDAARAFIRDHVTFEETLASDGEEDARSDASEDRAAEPEDPRRPGATEEREALQCPLCACAFSSATRLAHHLRSHERGAGPSCCGAPYPARRELLAHLRLAHARPAAAGACRACGHAARSAAALRAHVAAAHPDRPRAAPAPAAGRGPKTVPAACPRCDRTFSNKYNMLAHLRRHAAPAGAPPAHACAACGKRYSTRGNLAQHARLAHAGRLPYACGACGERFPARAARDVHARAHDGARPFRCERCPAAFRSRDSLAAHAAAHRDLRPHACALCARRFRKGSHLAAHARTHRPR